MFGSRTCRVCRSVAGTFVPNASACGCRTCASWSVPAGTGSKLSRSTRVITRGCCEACFRRRPCPSGRGSGCAGSFVQVVVAHAVEGHDDEGVGQEFLCRGAGGVVRIRSGPDLSTSHRYFVESMRSLPADAFHGRDLYFPTGRARTINSLFRAAWSAVTGSAPGARASMIGRMRSGSPDPAMRTRCPVVMASRAMTAQSLPAPRMLMVPLRRPPQSAGTRQAFRGPSARRCGRRVRRL